MTTVSINVDVDVDLSEITDDDLIEELQERGTLPSSFQYEMTEMFYAFKLGKNDRAMEIAKSIAQEHQGMIL